MGSKQATASKEMISKRLLCLLSTLMAVALVNSKSADLVRRINKASIDVCLEGWLRGEASIIGAHADQENFYFEWVPTGDRYPFAEFPAFYNQFKGDALERTGWYNVTFYNFIQWEEGTQLYESAQWVVDGYDSGDYTLMVDNGLLKWGRTQKLPYLTKETFQGKHLCNKPDRVCKTAVVKAKKAQVNSRSAELTTRINKASIDVCLEGWLRGEASIIGAHADQENFYFEWVPTGERYPFKEFPAFYKQIKGDALARTAGTTHSWWTMAFSSGAGLRNCHTSPRRPSRGNISAINPTESARLLW